MAGFIRECLAPPGFLSSAQNFAEYLGNRMKEAFRVTVERTDKNIFSFYEFPEQIRKSLYTGNAIEGFNSELKRETRKRNLLNSEDNATIVITAV